MNIIGSVATHSIIPTPFSLGRLLRRIFSDSEHLSLIQTLVSWVVPDTWIDYWASATIIEVSLTLEVRDKGRAGSKRWSGGKYMLERNLSIANPRLASPLFANSVVCQCTVCINPMTRSCYCRTVILRIPEQAGISGITILELCPSCTD